MDRSWHKGIIWLKCAVVLDLTWFWFWSLVDRRRSFLSRGRSFFLEPDADMEDSESRSPVCTPGINSLCHAIGWYMRMVNGECCPKFVSFSFCSSLPPWSLPSPWTSSSVSITTNQETFPARVSSTLDALRMMWETFKVFFQLYVVC